MKTEPQKLTQIQPAPLRVRFDAMHDAVEIAEFIFPAQIFRFMRANDVRFIQQCGTTWQQVALPAWVLWLVRKFGKVA